VNKRPVLYFNAFMVKNNFAVYGVTIVLELLKDILMFPVWWYSRGLFALVLGIVEFLKNREKSLALSVWLKNIFKPMYGQSDWQGILISIFIRIVQIIFRSILLLVYFLLAVIVFMVWVLMPLLIVYEIIFQLSGFIS
jgi:hypothetical protein